AGRASFAIQVTLMRRNVQWRPRGISDSGTYGAKRRRLEYIITIIPAGLSSMYRHSFRTYPLTCLSLLAVAGALSAQTSPSTSLTYPVAARGTQVDVYHGTSIADPYRWLEDVDAPATTQWVAAENRVTDAFLATIPERAAIRNRLTQLWNYSRYSAPFKENGRYLDRKR